MMKILSVLAIALMMWASTSTPTRASEDQKAEKPATQVCTLKVSGMTCAGCEAAVRMAARSVDGVTAVKASYAKGNAEVTFDPSKTTPAAIAKVVTEKSGFKAEPVQPTNKK
jgi:copper chaperone CopZ